MPAREPIRVLHLRDSPWVDGPGRTILESGSHFDPARVEFHLGAFVAAADGSHPFVRGARERRLSTHEIVDRAGFDRGVLRRIEELVDTLRIDLLHTSDIRTNLFGWLVRRRRPRLTLVSTAHGWIANTRQRKIMRFLDKMVLGRFDRVVLVSDAMRRLVPEWWLPASRTLVIRNALVLETYGKDHLQPRPVRTDPEAPVVLLNVGRLSPEKGQDLLLDAFATLARKHPRLRLHFAGIGPCEKALREQAERLGVADRVSFLGFIADMPALYRTVDLVVQSSLTEGLPNVVLECAYLRVPQVATAVGGTAEVIEHGSSGWLIKPGSVDEITAGIQAYLDDPPRFAAMGEVAHERIKQHFSFDARTERMTELYESLLGRTS